jgi:RNA-directed DNA polymerase
LRGKISKNFWTFAQRNERRSSGGESIEQPSYDAIWDFPNLFLAYQRAIKGKRSRPDVTRFTHDLEWHLIRLRDSLANKTYRPGSYRHFTISDPKPRFISAAPFRDRVVHHALCNIIEPLFERRFIADSYASRPGKGIHAALDRCTAYARQYSYALRCDIVQFFPSVDLTILQRILAREIHDPDILHLCHLILMGGSQELVDHYSLVLYPGDIPMAAAIRPRGLPIGNQTSQFWANCYLDRLDHFIKDELGCHGYLRYVDDMVLFSQNRDQLHMWKKAIIQFLTTHLRLIIHEPESNVIPVSLGIPFLGFRIYPDHRLLRRRNGVAFARRFRGMVKDYRAGTMSLQEMDKRVQGWVAHISHGDTWRLRHSIFSRIVLSSPEESA